MVVGEKQEIQWSSEDGEPQGTAGAPILRMIVERGLTNLAIVVTRYFGGIKAWHWGPRAGIFDFCETCDR